MCRLLFIKNVYMHSRKGKVYSYSGGVNWYNSKIKLNTTVNVSNS